MQISQFFSKIVRCGLPLIMLGFGCAEKSHLSNVEEAKKADVVQSNVEVPVLETTTLVLDFDKGSSQLSQKDKDGLTALIEKANYDASADKISVAVWSDQTLPVDGRPLKKSDRQLATRRSEQIKLFLKNKYKISNPTLYNMADQSNWAAHAFNTKDSEMKSLFAKDQSAPMSDEDFNLIKLNGAAGKAVFVISHK